MQVKICGVTTVDDARACADAGADLIGLNFYDRSPRCVSLEGAADIVHEVANRVEAVGVFVSGTAEKIRTTATGAGVSSVQLHGNISPDVCRELAADFRVIRAIATGPNFVPADLQSLNVDVMIDAYHPLLHGGTGLVCDWEAARAARPFARFLMLSGGLNERNVGEAIATVRADAVDVCSGVETEPGKKDIAAVARFIAAANAARVL